MKTLLATLLFATAALAHAQPLEADLDGNASALQASEMQPRPQMARGPAKPHKDRKGVRTLFLGTARSSPEKGS